MSNLASSDTAANASGNSCGVLMSEMYSDYKTTGKVNVLDSKTILNMVELEQAGYRLDS
jgi:hypothetical protein